MTGLKLARHRVVLIGVAVFIAAFTIYLWILYGQLTTAFKKQSQFIPTRFYSDVTRIAPPNYRGEIIDRLKALAYQIQDTGETIQFKLHSQDYPTYLIPDGSPVSGAGDQPVVLHMAGTERADPVQSIELGGREVPELFLEPELIATLSRGGNATDRQIRDVVKFEDVPAPVWKAIISVEDPRFLEHVGLDPRGLLRAIWVDLRTRSLAQGGSTITLQLVKNLTERRGRNIFRKVNEIFLALLLEATFEKEQILERYLNEVYLGQVGAFEIHGVSEGARLFFDKNLDELNLAEMAFMAGVIRGPAYYSPYKHKERAIERQRFVLKRMVENGAIAEAEAKEAERMPLRFAPPQNTTNKAPYFADFVKAELIRNLKDRVPENEIPEKSLRVYTTLDMRLSGIAQRAVADGIASLEKRMKIPPPSSPNDHGLEGALATVDQSTGYIRALVGGKSYAKSTFNRILNMKRQVGSTFKPFVYLTAFLKGYDSGGVPYSPGHPVEDAPWTLVYDKGRQNWTPKNYEKEFLGWTDYRRALAHSINTVAAKLGYEIGIPNVINTSRALGIESPLPNVPSLALGVAELSPIELLRAYEVLANHGVQEELTVIRAITEDDGSAYARFIYNPKTVYERGPVDLLTHMMQSVFTEGTAAGAAAMGFEHQAAGKTGTTSNHRDSWFAGYTPHLTTVVWVGADQTPAEEALEAEREAKEKGKKKKKEKEVKLTGASAALPIWVQFMSQALKGESPAQFDLGSDLVDVPIDRHTGKRADVGCSFDQVVTEKFAKGFEPKDSSCTPDWPPSASLTKE